MKYLFRVLPAFVLGMAIASQATAVDQGQRGSRMFKISLSELNSVCHLNVKNKMQLSDIFSARLPENAMKAYVRNDKFIVEVPNIQNLVHEEVDDEATFAGKVLDKDPTKNHGKGVTLFRTFYRDSDDTFYLRCQPAAGRIFGDTYKINNNGALTKIQ